MKASGLKAIDSLGHLLLLNIVNMFLSDVDDVVVADLKSVT